MRFERCSYLDGRTHLTDRSLVANLYEDLVLLGHGLYHLNGNLLKSSGVYRGSEHLDAPQSVGGGEITARSSFDGRRTLPPADYFWLGLFQTHFGHFLVGTLARLWAWKEFGGPTTTLAYVGDRDPSELFAIPYVAFCFTALGIEQRQLHRVHQNELLPRVRVPDPAFVENYCASAEYAAVVRRIREHANPRCEPIDGLVYISKQKLTGGVRGIVNEAEFAECLRGHGAMIVFPEDLSFSDQIALWANASGTVTGFAGSAFHVAAFAAGKSICTIAPHYWASSNQVLLDLLSGNRTVTAQAFDMIELQPAVPEFQDLLKIVDPKRMADLFIQFVQAHG
jgi:capsular polysaccharide biosynthesis protein